MLTEETGTEPGNERTKIKMTFQPVTIWHNSYRDTDRIHVPMIDGFDPEHNAMTPVFTYADTGNSGENAAIQIAADAYMAFNAPEEDLRAGMRQRAERYRALRLRSLSVGDVVQVGRRYLAVERTGWRVLTASQARQVTVVPVPADEDPFRPDYGVITSPARIGGRRS